MRLLVCGPRDWNDRNLVFAVLRDYWEPFLTVISGCASGVDRYAIEFAECHGLEIIRFRADWKKHGRAAGPMRNTQMLVEGKPDAVCAFAYSPNLTRGTQDMVTKARNASIPVKVWTPNCVIEDCGKAKRG